MKNFNLVGLVIIIISGSCSKIDEQKNEIQNCYCLNYINTFETVDCSGTLCSNDTCQIYFDIWKELFLERNQMTEEYFDNHITPCKTNLHKWKDGISFEVYFKVKIGWIETKLYDDFVILLSSNTTGLYSSLGIPRSVLLSKDQINILVNNYAFSSRIFIVSPINNSKFNSLSEALKAMTDSASVDSMCISRIYYQIPNRNFHPTGHPYLEASGFLNCAENRCVFGQMDLFTGEVKITHGDCWIINK